MMGALGRFLELSLPAADVLRSLAFYRSLGFAELTTGDIRGWHYAVVTDGKLAIGLHGAGVAEPALAFVRPNLARQVDVLQGRGEMFEFARLGADEFHEAGLRSPDGHLVLMLEARTFSPGTAVGGEPVPLIGRCREVTLACQDTGSGRAWFERAGFLADDAPEEAGVTRLKAPGVTIGLRPAARRGVTTLRFAVAAPDETLRRLRALGFDAASGPEGQALTAPEGTRLLIGR